MDVVANVINSILQPLAIVVTKYEALAEHNDFTFELNYLLIVCEFCIFITPTIILEQSFYNVVALC